MNNEQPLYMSSRNVEGENNNSDNARIIFKENKSLVSLDFEDFESLLHQDSVHGILQHVMSLETFSLLSKNISDENKRP